MPATTATTATAMATYASYASFAIGALSAVASGVQQYQQAKAQVAYQDAQNEAHKKAWEQNAKAIAQEYADQSAAERVSQMQEKEKTSEQVQEAQREAMRKAGTMMASTNAAGGTLQFLLDDYTRQEALEKEAFRSQYAMNSVASDIAVQSYRNRAQNRLDSQQGYTYIDNGNSGMTNAMLTTALGIGGAAVNAYGMYKKWTPNEGGPANTTGNKDGK